MVELKNLLLKKEKICVVGLGYVGLPLAVLLGQKFSVIGFDIKESRIEDLKKGIDLTGEVLSGSLSETDIEFTAMPEKIKEAKFIILAIPTPVDKNNRPDLTPVVKASETVGKNLSRNSIIVYESTVYPGVTEEMCVPILEKESGLKCGVDFKVGYSPERVNPGDKEHAIDKIFKVVSGQDQETLDLVDGVYGTITKTHRAPSIKVAEAAKVIENTQRDLNIALMNELSIIFHKLNIDTKDVLAAAGTKWNFLKFTPGLVGGHCIGVDPYYLTYRAEEAGYHPEVILAGRRINDNMGKWIVGELIKKIAALGKTPSACKVLICGITFKENVPDVRNSKVVDIYNELLSYGIKPVVCDPHADSDETNHEYGIVIEKNCPVDNSWDLIIIAVPHKEFGEIDLSGWQEAMTRDRPLFADLKAIFNKNDVEKLGINYWRL